MKKLYLLTLTVVISTGVTAQTHWTKHPDNPVLVPGAAGEWDQTLIRSASVLFHEGTYHMWYSKGSIGYATSPDGINWIKYESNPVIPKGEEGSWDAHILMYPTVLFRDDEFHMWYSGHSGGETNANWKIGYATSPDGINWTRNPGNPVLDVGPDGSWDDVLVWAGSALHDGSQFHIWYSGWDGTDDNVVTGHATSEDGVTWTKDPNNPVLTAGTWDNPRCRPGAMLYDGVNYHSWYTGGVSGAGKIGYAVSEDGSAWTKKYDRPVMDVGQDGEWDADYVSAETVIYDSTEEKYKMWYMGGTESGPRMVGYAESSIYVDIPDAAFLYALIDEGVDTNEDSLISYEEAEAMTNLDVRFYTGYGRGNDEGMLGDIIDMTGIEAFISLDTLRCGSNYFKYLDVSKNTALKYLECTSWYETGIIRTPLDTLIISNNPKLEVLNCRWNSLSRIELANTIALKEIECSDNPPLQHLDLSECPSLIELYGPTGADGLTSLNISNSPDLTVLNCAGNALENLDISNNLVIKELNCQSNHLNHLDVSNNTLLESLICHNNQLTSLDVSNNPFLRMLDCGHHRHYDKEGNHLTSLNISANNAITYLSVTEMPTLSEVCVWDTFFNDMVNIDIDTTGSPNVCFQTDCNGDCSIVGVGKSYPQEAAIYPNPTGNFLNIETVISDHYSINITSVNGKQILSGEIKGTTHQLDLSSFQKGIYFITIRSEDFVTTRKIIKL